jgi:glutamate 5-kinase
VETAVKLRNEGHKVIIVSSGAIGVGLQRMELDKRPKHLPKIQALAAVGQSRLMSLWDSFFAHLGQPVAQILLTRNDISDVGSGSPPPLATPLISAAQRTQYLNAQNTLLELLNMGVVPIVNENDTISVSVGAKRPSVMAVLLICAPRKSNSAIMIPSPQSRQPWFRRITSS